ncbi:XRE family transcriptional regulator [Clostridium perfringens]|uniref:XRE family transcriptional regulator n=1 Tax=Clostridium perfringens TaxID=1502 RepID=UPI00399CEAF0
MKLENTSIRLKNIMKERNLRQVDLLEMLRPFCNKYNVKINKSDISQYLSGKVKPGQEKLSMLGMALNVNESWLMGYDVPMERINLDDYKERMLQFANNHNKNFFENKLLNSFNKLNDYGKEEAIKRIDELSELPKYQKDNVTTLPKREKQIWEEPGKEYLMPKASHDKEGEFTEEDYKHDDDLMNDEDIWK